LAGFQKFEQLDPVMPPIGKPSGGWRRCSGEIDYKLETPISSPTQTTKPLRSSRVQPGGAEMPAWSFV
jgi:hypothetical protein